MPSDEQIINMFGPGRERCATWRSVKAQTGNRLNVNIGKTGDHHFQYLFIDIEHLSLPTKAARAENMSSSSEPGRDESAAKKRFQSVIEFHWPIALFFVLFFGANRIISHAKQ